MKKTKYVYFVGWFNGRGVSIYNMGGLSKRGAEKLAKKLQDGPDGADGWRIFKVAEENNQ